MIEVVCGIIYDQDGRILFCRRNSNKHLGGFWEFPGGKIEKNELPKIALKRELFEELEMKVENIEYFYSTEHKYEKNTIKLFAYKCKVVEYPKRLSDHDQIEWLNLENLIEKKIAPADVPIIEKLILKK